MRASRDEGGIHRVARPVRNRWSAFGQGLYLDPVLESLEKPIRTEALDLKEIKFRIVHISDTHISPFGHFAGEVFDRAAKRISKLDPRPDLTIHSGDLTNNGVLPEYELALEKLKLFELRPLFCPGNHDQMNYGQSLFREMVSPMDVEEDVGKMVVFLMNSPMPDRDEGRLGRRRQSFLDERLEAIGKDRFRVVVFHHHLVPVPLAGRETNVMEDAGDVLEMLLRHGVDLVVMGHRHVRRALKIENTVLLNASTLSSIRTRGRLGHSFNVVDVFADGGMRITEKNLTTDSDLILGEYQREASQGC